MRGSYFSRILPGSGHPSALAPQRPVTSLWKTAQIERTRQNGLAHPPIEPGISARPNRPARPTVIAPHTAQPATPLESSIQHAKTKAPPSDIQSAAPRQQPRITTADSGVRLKAEASTIAPLASERAVPVAPAAHQLPLTAPATLRETVSANARAEVARLFAPPPRATAAQRVAPSPTPNPVAQSPSVPALLEPAQPHRQFEAPTRETPRTRAAEPAEARRTTVHIGKIEVQVVPPVTQIRPPVTAAQPRPRLARGYGLWTGR